MSDFDFETAKFAVIGASILTRFHFFPRYERLVFSWNRNYRTPDDWYGFVGGKLLIVLMSFLDGVCSGGTYRRVLGSLLILIVQRLLTFHDHALAHQGCVFAMHLLLFFAKNRLKRLPQTAVPMVVDPPQPPPNQKSLSSWAISSAKKLITPRPRTFVPANSTYRLISSTN